MDALATIGIHSQFYNKCLNNSKNEKKIKLD